MYAGVPKAASASLLGCTRTSGSSALGSRSRCAIPKSPSFTTPFFDTSTFAGFTSRWTTPRSCACASPRAISRPMVAANSAEKRARLPMIVARLNPSTSSSTSHICEGVFTKSWRTTTPGWLSDASTRASLSSWTANGELGWIVLFSALIATPRPSGSCTARYTVEREPDPSSSTTR